MPTKRKKFKKRIFLINRDLQFRFARIAFFIGFISTLLCTVVILYPLFQFEILRIPKFLPLPILSAMVFATILNICCIMFLAIIITHRIAGPVFALSREFTEMSQGVFGRELQLRKTDDLRYLSRCFNEMSVSLKNLTYDDIERITLALDTIKSLEQELATLTMSAEENDDQEYVLSSDKMESLKEQLAHLVTHLGLYSRELQDRVVPNESNDQKKDTLNHN
ncbi:MAG: hypothetical protein OXC40_00845 [Proteobacteria bacterium]|nr:hypothetical protein [Pseudomonadota bacterium]